MPMRRDSNALSLLATATMLLGFIIFCAPASAAPPPGSFLPAGFFDSVPYTADGQAAVEADTLAYDAVNDVISAEGNVVMTYAGYVIRAQKLKFDRRTGALTAPGEVAVADPKGGSFVTHDLQVTGGFRQAFMRTLTFHSADGSLITADSADYSSELLVVLQNGMYSPCGNCIDAKGRRIGWKVHGARIVYNRKDASVTVEQPVLELLGVPLVWLPWLRVPDPSQPRANGFRFPAFDYSKVQGLSLTYPYFYAIDPDTDLLISPRLMSRQGGLLAADLTHRFSNGTVDVKVAAVYQLDRSAFTGTVGDTDWRGAIQTSGYFVPIPHWGVGWSYTAFTDAAFLPDYKLVTGVNSVNEVYVTHLSRDYFGDLRLQQFNLLGNYTQTTQDQNAKALPNLRAGSVTDLPEGWGQLRAELRVLGVQRGADQPATYGGVPYVFAYQENKAHATLDVNWQDQVVVPGGLAVTPYLGLRGDAAYYDGSSALLAGPISMLTATPIAALDVRFPMVADDGLSSYLFEPIAQVVYRGSSTTEPGITNDDALSFVFDDTNLFSYNRFSGTDRQETGLRANLGAHYLANFADGSWLDLIGGQSYFLSGVNSLGVADTANVGASTGLGSPASYVVFGGQAGFNNELTAAGKVDIDPAKMKLSLAGVGAHYSNAERFSAGLDYTYIAADPVLGLTTDQHEITASAGVPIDDYWTATATGSWDLAANTWLEAGAGFVYDDGYLQFGLNGVFTGPTNVTPNDFRASATFNLKGPAGNIGFSR